MAPCAHAVFYLSLLSLGIGLGLGKPLCRESLSSEWRDCRVQVGGLAIQGAAAFHQKQGPTFQTYLTEILGASHGLEFEAIALDFNQNFEYVAASELDFVYSNPAAYTCMMAEFQLTTIASLMNFRKGNSLNQFAGVIFARANASELNGIDDLRKAKVSAVSISGLGAMQLQQGELLKKGLNIMTDVVQLSFTGNQNKIIEDVEQGYSDIGFVRTDMIDRSVAAGETKWEYFKVINLIEDASFPFRRSTAFTPEWPIGALKHVPDDVKELVGRALMDLDRDSTDPRLSQPGIAGSFKTWVPPMNYLGLLGMLEDIRYYDPVQRRCLRSADVYEAIHCPEGYVKQSRDNAFCKMGCKSGYTCLCQPCSKLRDPELVLSVSPNPTQWKPMVNTSQLQYMSKFSHECERMHLCVKAARGQSITWSLLDQVGRDNRLKINAPVIEQIDVRLAFDSTWQKLQVENISLGQDLLQRYVLNTTAETLGMSVVEVRVNGQQAQMSPVAASYFEPPLNQLECPPGQALSNMTGRCSDCPAGKHSVGGYDSCRPCSPGSNQSLTGQDQCVACPAGTVSPSFGTSICSACPAGRSTRGKPGAILCELCDPGSSAPDTGSERCSPCLRGSFSKVEGASLCDGCGGGQTTRELGSKEPSQCVCGAGEYWSNDSALELCARCPDHITCDLGTVAADLGLGSERGARDQAQIHKGFFSEVSDPTFIYRCWNPDDCKGGPLLAGDESCGKQRSGFLCQECPHGYVQSSSGCHKCEWKDTVLLIVIVVVALAAVPMFLVLARKKAVKEHPQSALAVSFGGLAVFLVQIMAALSAVQVQWNRPFNDILSVLMLASIDLDIVNIGCIGSVPPANLFVVKLLLPLVAVCGLILVALTCRLLKICHVDASAMGNAIGQIAVMFLITISLAVLVPFQCYEHPNGYRSIVSAPTVTCWNSTTHSIMVAASVFGITIYIAGTCAVVIFAVLRYSTEIASDNIRFLQMFRFLFMRFRPECYWFGAPLLLRNAMMVLCPMLLPPERADLALLLMSCIMLVSVLASAGMAPYRSVEVNVTDSVLQASVLLILSIGSMTLDKDNLHPATSWVAASVSVIMLAFCIGMFMWKLCFLLQPAPKFTVFLSHHKAGGACAARCLKILLARSVKGPIFFDSDCLKSFTGIFDAVKESKSVLVILSGETLCRPWCVGELVTAYVCNISMQTVTVGSNDDKPLSQTLDKWQSLDVEEMKALFGKFEVLRPHGISLDDIVPSIKKALEKPTIHLNMANSTTLMAKLEEALSMTGVKSKHASSMMSSTPPMTGDLLLMCDQADCEAVASSRVLKDMIQQKTRKQVLMDFMYDTAPFKQLLQSPTCPCICWLMTSATLQSPMQLARVTLLFKLRPGCTATPVLIGDAFSFPGEDYYNSLAEHGGSIGPDANSILSKHADMELRTLEAAEAVRRVLQSIAYFVNVPYANEQMLHVAVNSLIDGMPALLSGATVSLPMSSDPGQQGTAQDTSIPDQSLATALTVEELDVENEPKEHDGGNPDGQIIEMFF